MANDRNRVVLLGTLQDLRQEQVVQVDGQPSYVVRARLCTDQAAYGGSHPVVFTGPLALRVMAHWQACRAAQHELELWVDGRLRTGEQETMVVVQHTTFLVAKEVQVQANMLLAERDAAGMGRKETAEDRPAARARTTR
jgi:hypothetical protein